MVIEQQELPVMGWLKAVWLRSEKPDVFVVAIGLATLSRQVLRRLIHAAVKEQLPMLT